MPDTTETPQDVPAAPAPPLSVTQPSPRSDHLSDIVTRCLQAPEGLCKVPRGGLVLRLGVLVLTSMALVGLLLGAFAGGWQLLAAPVKTVVGTFAAMALCLPSLFVFSNLSGSPLRLADALTSMFIAIAVMTLVLLALAPIGLVFTLSTHSQILVGAIHVAFLGLGACYGGRALARIWNRSPVGDWLGAATWIMLFTVVLLQLATAFRPIIGAYAPIDLSDKRVFLQHWSAENAP